MKFSWDDNFTKEFPPYANIVGLKHNGCRATSVTLTYNDFKEVFKAEKSIKKEDYWFRLHLSLQPESKINE